MPGPAVVTGGQQGHGCAPWLAVVHAVALARASLQVLTEAQLVQLPFAAHSRGEGRSLGLNVWAGKAVRDGSSLDPGRGIGGLRIHLGGQAVGEGLALGLGKPVEPASNQTARFPGANRVGVATGDGARPLDPGDRLGTTGLNGHGRAARLGLVDIPPKPLDHGIDLALGVPDRPR